ncbi:MAG TPA: pilus assembly protein [Chloroflexota bacterium]|jgi:hypothetical protein
MQDRDAAPKANDPSQGLVETIIIGALVLVVVVAILLLLGPPLLQQLSHIIARS